MKYFFIIFMLFSTDLLARRIILKHPMTNEVLMVRVHDSGKISSGTVLADEKNGPIPQAVMDQYLAAKSARDSIEAGLVLIGKNRKDRLKAIDWSQPLTESQIRAILKDLVEKDL